MTRVVCQIADHNRCRDTRDRGLDRMLKADGIERRGILPEGRRVARLVNDLGSAMLAKKRSDAEIIAIVDELVELGQLTPSIVGRICDEAGAARRSPNP